MRSALLGASAPWTHRRTAAILLEYRDLGSRVYLGHVPVSLTDALAGLYGSCYCLVDHFELMDRPANVNACVLEDPRHVVLFTCGGRDVVILNQLFAIDGTAARRVCESIFRALPNVRRVRINGFEVDPFDIGLPYRTLWTATDLVVPLPPSVEDYEQGLGRSTRKNLRRYMNRLSKNVPEFAFEVREKRAIGRGLVAQIVAFNRVRMEVSGRISGISELDEQLLGKMLAGHGFAGVLKVQEKVIAGCLGTAVGSSYFLHVQAFDQPYAELHPGLLCTFLTVCAAIERGGRELHFLWGDARYKRQLGGEPRTVYNASLYRDKLSRSLGVSEIAWLTKRRVATWRAYRRLRNALALRVRMATPVSPR